MILEFGKKWRLRSDPNQWISEKLKTNKKTGEKYWKSVGYYFDIQQAIYYLNHQRIKEIPDDYTITQIQDALDVIKEDSKEVSKILDVALRAYA